MKSNADKCHLFVSTNANVIVKIGNSDVNNKRSEKLLRVELNQRLIFDDHILDLCKTVNRKIHALSRITPYMNLL